MARVGEEFPLDCPNCGGDIRLITFRLLYDREKPLVQGWFWGGVLRSPHSHRCRDGPRAAPHRTLVTRQPHVEVLLAVLSFTLQDVLGFGSEARMNVPRPPLGQLAVAFPVGPPASRVRGAARATHPRVGPRVDRPHERWITGSGSTKSRVTEPEQENAVVVTRVRC